MTIVIINGMSIVCVLMYTIDVCYCVDCYSIVLCMLFGMCGGMVYVLQNL